MALEKNKGCALMPFVLLRLKPAYRTVFWQICKVQNFVLAKLPKAQSLRLMIALLLIWIQKREMPILLAYRMRKFSRRYFRVHVC